MDLSIFNKILAGIYYRKLKPKMEWLSLKGRTFSDISSCMVIIPENPQASDAAKSFVLSLLAARKNVTIFLRDSMRSEFNDIKGADFFSYNSKNDLNYFKVLSSKILGTLRAKKFDVVFDLNTGEGLFSRVVTLAPESKIRVGTGPRQWERFYNISYLNSQNNYDLLYKNLLNSLSQF